MGNHLEPILEAEIESFSYGHQQDLQFIEFKAYPGECIVLTGKSGCGKTTLLRLLNGLIPAIYEGEMKGRIQLFGKDLSSYGKGELAKYMGNVFQNPKDQFFSTIAEDEVALVGENMGMDRRILTERVNKAFKIMDVTELKDCSVFEMSGGERQKIAITSTLVYDTKILLFDEPSASLDYEATEELKRVIQRLKNMGKTIIIAEHRLHYLMDICDRLVLMEKGRLIGEYFPGQWNDALRRKHGLRCFREEELKAEMDPPEGSAKVFLENFVVGRRGTAFLPPFNVQIAQGECMAVIGPNGIGKTTLAKQLCGLLPLVGGKTNLGKRKKQRIKSTYYVLQDADSQLFFNTVENELVPKKKRKDKDYCCRVSDYLKSGDLWDKRLEHPHELSAGEKQRLALLTAFVEDRRCIILDEPTAGLDYERMHLIAQLIRQQAEITPIILITHDWELLFKVCNSALLLSKDNVKKISTKNNESIIMDFFKTKIP